MANVKFLRGLQANLPADGSGVQDGVFYLTTDTNRLYVGQGTSKKLLNQTVQIVSSLDDLTTLSTQWATDGTSNSHINDFYYISPPKNILAVYTGTGADGGWVQINPDHNTTVNGTSLEATSTTTNNVTLTLDIEDSDNTPDLDSSVHFVGDGTAHVGVDNNGNIKITGDQYTLSAPSVTADKRTATVTLTNNNNTSLNSTLVIESANPTLLSIENDSNKIKLTPYNTTLDGGSAAASVTVNNGTLGISVTDSDGGNVSDSKARIGLSLNDGTYAPLIQAAEGTNTGAIYSKAEIDNKLAGLDGMTYKGTIGATGATISELPTTGVKNGDVYVITSSGYTGFGENAHIDSDTGFSTAGVRVGDMLIAKGTESLQTISGTTDYFINSNDLTWTYIPSGNDSLDVVTYNAIMNAANNSVGLENENNETIVQHNLVGGTNVELSSTLTSGGNRTNNILTTTINHETIGTTTAPAATLTGHANSFTAIKDIQVSNGHVTSITTDTFEPIIWQLSGATATATANNNFNLTTGNGVSDVDVTINLLDSSNNDHTIESQAKFNLHSDTIHISAGANGAMTMNLEWGTF